MRALMLGDYKAGSNPGSGEFAVEIRTGCVLGLGKIQGGHGAGIGISLVIDRGCNLGFTTCTSESRNFDNRRMRGAIRGLEVPLHCEGALPTCPKNNNKTTKTQKLKNYEAEFF